jgi:hypothetical protein
MRTFRYQAAPGSFLTRASLHLLVLWIGLACQSHACNSHVQIQIRREQTGRLLFLGGCLTNPWVAVSTTHPCTGWLEIGKWIVKRNNTDLYNIFQSANLEHYKVVICWKWNIPVKWNEISCGLYFFFGEHVLRTNSSVKSTISSLNHHRNRFSLILFSSLHCCLRLNNCSSMPTYVKMLMHVGMCMYVCV